MIDLFKEEVETSRKRIDDFDLWIIRNLSVEIHKNKRSNSIDIVIVPLENQSVL